MKIWKLALLVFIFSLSSCGARKSSVTSKSSGENKIAYEQLPNIIELEEEHIENIAEETFSIVDYARQFLGTKYKYGGTSPEGMDCSGLIYTSFLKNEIQLPRSSRAMALLGEQLDLSEVRIGDLLFFITDKRKKSINHVGLVVELDAEHIFFIHSSTSRGVIISALTENYWREHFIMARRIL